MRKISLFAVLLILGAMPVFAQDSKVDIFGGYSFLHSNPGSGLPAGNASGWEATLGYNWTHWLGLEADFDGHYCCAQSMHNFLFGPQINLGHGKLAPYLHGLVGASHGSAGTVSDTVLGYALGGGVDVKWTQRISVRLVQADYLGTRYADNTQNNFRFSAGLVLHLGSK